MKKIISLSFYSILIVLISILLQSNHDPSKLNNKSRENISINYIPWIKNVGQYQSDILFKTTTFVSDIVVKQNRNISYYNNYSAGYSILFEESFLNPLKSKFEPKGLNKTKTKVNYFVGKRENHFSNISTFKIIDLGEVWKGIEVKLKATNKNYEKLFIVDPSTNPNQINIEIKGVNDLCINEYDELQVDLSTETICFTKPKAWQEINGKIVDVKVDYQVYLHENSFSYGFEIGAYDKRFPLLIDPLLASTYLGGNYTDIAKYLTVAKNNKVFIAGTTNSDTFPCTVEAFDTTYNDEEINDYRVYDIFIARLSSDLNTLEVCTYIGGNQKDEISGLEVDPLGNVYISGMSRSDDYPTTANAYDKTYNGGDSGYVIRKLGDIILSKLDNNLSTLLASTYIGGNEGDGSDAMKIDENGDIYITGIAKNNGIPNVGPQFHQNSYKGTYFLKINSELNNILATNSLGIHTGLYDGPFDMSIDTSGNIFVVGTTTSLTNFPTTPNCYDNSFNDGNTDGFIIKLNSNLNTNMGSTYYGSPGKDYVLAIAIDTSNNIYITGYTDSENFPVTNNAYDTSYNVPYNWGTEDAFVSKFNNNLTTLIASTYLGGQYDDYGNGILIDYKGDVFVNGKTGSGFPRFCNSLNYNYSGVFVCKLDSTLTNLKASSVIAGDPGDNIPYDIVQNNENDLLICGYTDSENFPMLYSYDSTYNGGFSDAFITKLTPDLLQNYLPCCTYLRYPEYRQKEVPSIVELRWDSALEANGYYLSIGTVVDSFSIVDKMDIGNVLSYTINDLPCNDSIYVTISAYNDVGIATGYYCFTSYFYTDNSYFNSLEDTICEGEEYEWEGNTYADSGIYEVLHTAINGCDSIVELILNVSHVSLISDTLGICKGDSLKWFDQYYYEEGSYYKNYTNINGCDSIYELVLEVNSNHEFFEYTSICQGDTLLWQGQQINYDGIYTAEYFSIDGCDSTMILDVKVLSEYFIFDTTSICRGDSLFWQGQSCNFGGDYIKMYLTEDGCDSIYYLNLSENSSYYFEDELSICEGDSMKWKDEYYSIDGNYIKSYQSINGCDSIYNLTLKVNEKYRFEEERSICKDESIEWQGMTFSEAGNYYANYQSIYNCDSNYQLILTIMVIDNSVYILGDSLIAVDNENASYQWLTCPDYEIIEGATQSIYLASESGSYAVEITTGDCIDTSACYNLIHSGLDETTSNIEFDIFPNPVFNNKFTVRPGNIEKSYSIEIIDISGKCVIKSDGLYGIQKIESHKLKSRVYIVSINTGSKKINKKIVLIN